VNKPEARNMRITKLGPDGEPTGESVSELRITAPVGGNVGLLAAALAKLGPGFVSDEEVDALTADQDMGLRVDFEPAPGGVKITVMRRVGWSGRTPVWAGPPEEPEEIKPCTAVPCPAVGPAEAVAVGLEAVAVGLEGVYSAEQLFWTSADLDRCEHGRHSVDDCLSCPGGRSTGNLFLMGPAHGDTRQGVHASGTVSTRIGTTVRGEPIMTQAHRGQR
jgi:hypothetical protein